MKILTLIALLCLSPTAHAQQTLHAKPGTIWVTFEEDGHQWMVGAPKQYALAQDDPGIVQTEFGKGYTVKVQKHTDTTLYHNCCATNIVIGATFTGTIQVGTNFMTAKELSDFMFRLEAFKTWAATNKATLQLRPNINRTLSR